MRFTGSATLEVVIPKRYRHRAVEEGLGEKSAKGDPMEELVIVVDFEQFRPVLERAAGRQRTDAVPGREFQDARAAEPSHAVSRRNRSTVT